MTFRNNVSIKSGLENCYVGIKGVKKDFIQMLTKYPKEANAILVAIKNGQIDGSKSSWEKRYRYNLAKNIKCGCFKAIVAEKVGKRCGDYITIQDIRKELTGDYYSEMSPIETFIQDISVGDTDENSTILKKCVEWIEEFKSNKKVMK